MNAYLHSPRRPLQNLFLFRHGGDFPHRRASTFDPADEKKGKKGGVLQLNQNMMSLALFPRLYIRCMKKAPKTARFCKRDKKRTGNLSVSGVFWSR